MAETIMENVIFPPQRLGALSACYKCLQMNSQEGDPRLGRTRTSAPVALSYNSKLIYNDTIFNASDTFYWCSQTGGGELFICAFGFMFELFVMKHFLLKGPGQVKM